MVIVYTKFDASVFLVSILKNNTHINKIDKSNIFIFKIKLYLSIDFFSSFVLLFILVMREGIYFNKMIENLVSIRKLKFLV